MRYPAFFFFSMLMLLSCQHEKNEQHNMSGNTVIGKPAAVQSQGEKLFLQYCFACHTNKPESVDHDKMIAPPISKVVSHYKPVYQNQKEFVDAIVSWVKKPMQEKILMPGAARKFGLMPPQNLNDDTLRIIANYLYETDFGKTTHAHEHISHRNDSHKVKLQTPDLKALKEAIDLLNHSEFKSPAAYQVAGIKIFNTAKKILLNKNYRDTELQQIQTFFHTLEDDMHHLGGVKSLEEGEKYRILLLEKLKRYKDFFE